MHQVARGFRGTIVSPEYTGISLHGLPCALQSQTHLISVLALRQRRRLGRSDGKRDRILPPGRTRRVEARHQLARPEVAGARPPLQEWSASRAEERSAWNSSVVFGIRPATS